MQLGRHRGIARPRGGLRGLDVRRQQRLLALSRIEAFWPCPRSRHSIAAIDLERGLDAVRSKAAGPAEGVFGPGSTIWQVDREALVFLGAGRALLLQLAHPWVATAIAEHSTALSDPIGRFHRTFEIVFTLVFGSLEQALATSRRLHRRHAAVSGHLPETLGPYAQGSPYLANEVSALMWVHATLVETALTAHDLVLEPLGAEPRARYYADCQLLGVLFGIPLDAQPPDWPAFARYFKAMAVSEELAVGPAAREIGSVCSPVPGASPSHDGTET